MQVVVIGLGLFGTSVAEALANAGEDVFAVDSSQDIVQQAADRGVLEHVACTDATVRTNLERLGIGRDYDVGVIGIGTSIEASVIACIHLRELGVERVIAKAIHETHQKILEKVGADRTLIPEVLSGKQAAGSIMNPSVLEELRFSDDFSILEVEAPLPLTGKSLIENDLRGNHGATLLGFKRAGQVSFEVDPSLVIEPGDILIVGVAKKHRERFLKLTEAKCTVG